MSGFNPDTYCGIYCGACSVVARGRTGRTPCNLEAIKRDGPERWLEDQKKRWTCQCGAPFSWYAQQRDQCGRSLKSEGLQMSRLSKPLCRVILPMAYRKGKSPRSTQDGGITSYLPSH